MCAWTSVGFQSNEFARMKLGTYMIISAIEIKLSKSNSNVGSRGEGSKTVFSLIGLDVVNCMSTVSFSLSHYPCTSISCLDYTCI
jgi:hypothetical protein